MTQFNTVKNLITDKEMTIKEISKETWFKEPNIRRILWQGTKQGIFRRLAPGVYMIEIWDKTKAIINVWDAIETIKTLKKNNYKFDMVFLDIPYDTPAIKGWNRWVKYSLITPIQFKSFLTDLKYCIHDDTHIYHMFSNAPSGWKKMQEYNNILIELWFIKIAEWGWQKTYKDWSPVKFCWRQNEKEGLNLYSLSGKIPDQEIQMNYETIRPKIASEKSISMLTRLIKQSTNPWDIILDPFSGSWSTWEAALTLDRNIVLIEKSPKRVHNEILPRLQTLFC